MKLPLFLCPLSLSVLFICVIGELPSRELWALLQFKNAIKEDPTGYILDSWNESTVINGCPVSWNGVVCNGSNVAAVVLDNLNIVADVDLSVFVSLKLLRKLSLSNNSISGKIPKNLDEFNSIEYLDISDNRFFSTLPPAIGTLQWIKNLSLAGNNFSGPIPESIGGLVSVVSLDLSRNSFSGSLPPSLTNLKRLVFLNLSCNVFTNNIPSGFELNPNLQIFDVHQNQLNGSIDEKFLLLSTVVHVDFSSNLLSSSGSREKTFLSGISDSIEYLNLSNNKFTGSLVTADGLPSFGNLKVLDLSYNELSGELPRFDFVYDLEVLRLRNNWFSGFLPNGLLNQDSLVLNELDLSANNLSGPIGMIMSTTLQVLNLSRNTISGELPVLTGSCKVIDLSSNLLTGNLSVLAKWGNSIEYLDLSHNKLSGSFPEATSEFLRLNYLNLSTNVLMNPLPPVLTQYPELVVLDLSFNQFSGNLLAELFTMPKLQELHLQKNMLVGSVSFPSPLPSKSEILIVDLSSNHFNGSLPDDFGSLARLKKLNLSENNFSGSLPHAVTVLTSLLSLDISLNQLSGKLPENLSGTLLDFNASYNAFSGTVPVNLRKFPDSSFHPGNPRLLLPYAPPGSYSVPSGKPSRKPIKTFFKLFVIIPSAFVGAIIISLAIFIVHRNVFKSRAHPSGVENKDTSRSYSSDLKNRDIGGALGVAADDLVSFSKDSQYDGASPDEKMAAVARFAPSRKNRFSWSPHSGESPSLEALSSLDEYSPNQLAGELHLLDETISLAPDELSRAPAEVLGRSSRGTSYRAILDNGITLTVKWLKEGLAKQKRDFTKEAKKLADIRHPNIVGLRGYYWGPTPHEKLILSDHISPGSLAGFLYDRPGRKGPLTWTQRLKVAVDAARGLNYLHFDRALPHGNLKATNILLDGPDLNARIADCCLHRLMTAASIADQMLDLAALGYLALELASAKKPSPTIKSDVYAFGVILLEILTGRCAAVAVDSEEGGANLKEWVRLRVEEGRDLDCFDSALAQEVADAGAAKGMKEVLRIALRCMLNVSERPGIKSVYEDLSSI